MESFEELGVGPELVEALVKSPMLVTEGLRFLEQATRQPRENPLSGIRGTLFAGFCLLSGAILVAMNGPWPLWAALFAPVFIAIYLVAGVEARDGASSLPGAAWLLGLGVFVPGSAVHMASADI